MIWPVLYLALGTIVSLVVRWEREDNRKAMGLPRDPFWAGVATAVLITCLWPPVLLFVLLDDFSTWRTGR